MFERPSDGERVLLVFISDSRESQSEQDSAREEFIELATSAGLEVIECINCNSSKPNPRSYVGRGKLDEIEALVQMQHAEAVLCSKALTPSQERNLEQHLKVRVLDRNALILDIFAQRARTFEGKLQVELAQLVHLSTRLVRGWTHLERQKGGIGLRGPGETQLETDRRLLAVRVKTIKRRLEKVRKQREQGRRMRSKTGVPTVALVGYTNAGKSTLFNRLTQEHVYVADQLFATLDPTLRRLNLGAGEHCILADTVGFVNDLPHELVDAFRSTLVETREADLLLHIIDAADEEKAAKIEQVNAVLADVNATDVPQVLVFNKADLIDQKARIDYSDDGQVAAIWLSAMTGEGCEQLPDVISSALGEERVAGWLHLEPAQGKLRSRIFSADAVISEEVLEDGSCVLEISVDRILFESWCKGFPEIVSQFTESSSLPDEARAAGSSN